jgi:Mn-dependent DtxR family transcriptional regulator
MATDIVDAYHTNSPELPAATREVYHNHGNCPDGKRIEKKHREPGTGGKRRCKECIKLD